MYVIQITKFQSTKYNVRRYLYTKKALGTFLIFAILEYGQLLEEFFRQ